MRTENRLSFLIWTWSYGVATSVAFLALYRKSASLSEAILRLGHIHLGPYACLPLVIEAGLVPALLWMCVCFGATALVSAFLWWRSLGGLLCSVACTQLWFIISTFLYFYLRSV